MSEYVVFFLMILCHIIYSFYLHGSLDFYKQKAWWDKIAKISMPQEEYFGVDYMVGLLIYGFGWAICVSLPILIATHFNPNNYIFVAVVIDAIISTIVDDLKINKSKISFLGEQIVYLGMICCTWTVYVWLI